MEEVLRQSEEKYRTILENIEDGYYEVDLNGNFTFFNDSACRIFGYPQEEMMGMNNRQYTDDENLKKVFSAFNGVYKTGVPTKEFAWQIIRKDGTKRLLESSISLQKDSSGKPIGFRGVTHDVTERRQAEEKLALNFETQAAMNVLLGLSLENRPYTAPWIWSSLSNGWRSSRKAPSSWPTRRERRCIFKHTRVSPKSFASCAKRFRSATACAEEPLLRGPSSSRIGWMSATTHATKACRRMGITAYPSCPVITSWASLFCT
jgi:PAS domain S-box-containing protein